MSAATDHAAAELLREIRAPSGAVNTLSATEEQHELIRVLVDPSYWFRLGSIPATYHGYPVRVEKRGTIEV